jgi:hypothetical protein
MSIDKESSGVPAVDHTRRTTKVNLGVVLAAAVFLVAMLIVVLVLARNSDRATNAPSPSIQQDTGAQSNAKPGASGSR